MIYIYNIHFIYIYINMFIDTYIYIYICPIQYISITDELNPQKRSTFVWLFQVIMSPLKPSSFRDVFKV